MSGRRITKINGTKSQLLLATMTLLLAMTIPGFAQDAQPGASMHEMRVPQSAADHSEMAEHYKKVAAELREDVEMHKKMLADFGKSVASGPKTGENPYVKKMRLHCEKYIKAAEALAAEADASANFHTMRAKEVEGK
jgi:hypothetical protein